MDLRELVQSSGIRYLQGKQFSLLGKGTNGEAWQVKGEPIIIKVGHRKNASSVANAQREFLMTKRARNILGNAVPTAKDFYGVEGVGSLMVLDKVKGNTLHNLEDDLSLEQMNIIKTKLYEYVKKLKAGQLIHGDINPNNIMVWINPKNPSDIRISLIDFGRSRFTNTKVHNRKLLHPWPTKLGCKMIGNRRSCVLRYVNTNNFWATRGAESNESFLKSFFPNNVPSIRTRIQEALNVLNSELQKVNTINKTQKSMLILKLKKLLKKTKNTSKLEEYIKRVEGIPTGTFTKSELNGVIAALHYINTARGVPAVTPNKRPRIPNPNRNRYYNVPEGRINIGEVYAQKLRKNVAGRLYVNIRERQIVNTSTGAITNLKNAVLIPIEQVLLVNQPKKPEPTRYNENAEMKRVKQKLLNQIKNYYAKNTSPNNVAFSSKIKIFKQMGGTNKELNNAKQSVSQPKTPEQIVTGMLGGVPGPAYKVSEIANMRAMANKKRKNALKEKERKAANNLQARLVYDNLLRMREAENKGVENNRSKAAAESNRKIKEKIRQNIRSKYKQGILEITANSLKNIYRRAGGNIRNLPLLTFANTRISNNQFAKNQALSIKSPGTPKTIKVTSNNMRAGANYFRKTNNQANRNFSRW
jgi:hypothetical protein